MRDGRIILYCFFTALTAILVVSVSWYLFIEYKVKGDERIPPSFSLNPNVQVSVPSKNSLVKLPLNISGQARVFENVVNIEIEDSGGNLLYKGFTLTDNEAVGEFGNFSQSVYSFLSQPTAGQILIKVYWESPEDDSSKDMVKIPVNLDLSQHRLVKIFYSNPAADSSDCSAVSPVYRFLGPSQTPLAQALSLLLKNGLTKAEMSAGLVNNIPPGVRINSLDVAEDGLHVDFSEELKSGVAGSCRVIAIRSQLEETLKQFGTVFKVFFTVNGSAEGVLEP